VIGSGESRTTAYQAYVEDYPSGDRDDGIFGNEQDSTTENDSAEPVPTDSLVSANDQPHSAQDQQLQEFEAMLRKAGTAIPPSFVIDGAGVVYPVPARSAAPTQAGSDNSTRESTFTAPRPHENEAVSQNRERRSRPYAVD